jgi:hypothetical protein
MKTQSQLIRKGEANLVIVKAEELMTTNLKILKDITREKSMGVYITVNNPYNRITKILDHAEIDTRNIFFIDCVTRTVGEAGERTGNCLYVPSPNSLTEIGIAVTQALQVMPSPNKFIFVDTLSSFIIYNPPPVLAKFSHFLINKSKIFDASGVFVVVKSELEERLLSEVMQFCDNIIKIESK